MATYTEADYKSIALGGQVAEDVMAKIVENVEEKSDTPFRDLIGSTTARNSYKEWTEERLPAIDLTNAANAVVDGSDAVSETANEATRLGNHHQIITRVAKVSTRANSVDLIGVGEGLARQVEQHGADIQRNKEAIMLSPQASQADDGASTEGLSAGFVSFLETHSKVSTGGSIGGFNFSTGVVAAPVSGAARSLTKPLLNETIGELWDDYSTPTIIMSVSSVIRKLNEFLTDQETGNKSGVQLVANVSGTTGENMVTNRYVSKYKTDHGVFLTIIANRNQQYYTTGTVVDALDPDEVLEVDTDVYAVADVYIFDPTYVMESTLVPFRVETLAKDGLWEKRMLSEDFSLIPTMERAHASIRDVSVAAPVIATVESLTVT